MPRKPTKPAYAPRTMKPVTAWAVKTPRSYHVHFSGAGVTVTSRWLRDAYAVQPGQGESIVRVEIREVPPKPRKGRI